MSPLVYSPTAAGLDYESLKPGNSAMNRMVIHQWHRTVPLLTQTLSDHISFSGNSFVTRSDPRRVVFGEGIVKGFERIAFTPCFSTSSGK